MINKMHPLCLVNTQTHPSTCFHQAILHQHFLIWPSKKNGQAHILTDSGALAYLVDQPLHSNPISASNLKVLLFMIDYSTHCTQHDSILLYILITFTLKLYASLQQKIAGLTQLL